MRARATHPFQPLQYYPANINTSRCCDQPICTECFVQIKRAEATATHLVRFFLPCAAEGGGGALVWFRGRPGIVDTDSTPSQHLSFVRSFGGPQESEPACCPFCMEPNFGILYDRPRVRIILLCSPISRLLRQSPDRLLFTHRADTLPTYLSKFYSQSSPRSTPLLSRPRPPSRARSVPRRRLARRVRRRLRSKRAAGLTCPTWRRLRSGRRRRGGRVSDTPTRRSSLSVRPPLLTRLHRTEEDLQEDLLLTSS